VDINTEFEGFKEFLGQELGGTKSPRRVTAATRGLGLESPPTRKKETVSHGPSSLVETLPPSTPEPQLPPKQSRLATVMDTPPLENEPAPAPMPAHVPQRKVTTAELVAPEAPITTPPPLPRPGPIRRLLATVIDEMFVLTLFAVVLVATANAMTGFTAGFSTQVFENFKNPAFVRIATLEFAVLWIGYFAISVGLLDSSFGMWVWGLRVSFGDRKDENFTLRRLMRVFWSVVFFAPVISLVLLAIRRRGRNILDTLSGTSLYLTH
jgi:uncharacterized RDD family membrane protein YckC